MSAIAGLLCLERHAVEAEAAERMAAAIGRRGGADDGSYCSPDGRAALAVRGGQALANETHDIWLVLDGEILNGRALRHTLELLGHRFRGSSDAEVALHAYEEWELDFPTHLSGAFALALWDDRRDRLVLARDRLGRKPLFVARHRGRLGFASGIGALLDELALPRRLDAAALAHYLALGCVPAPATLVAGVTALAAGEMVVAGRDGGPRRLRWRDTLPGNGRVPPLRDLPAERHAGNLRTLLECAVADRVAERGGDDGRVGLWLTPAPASGAIAAIATRLTGTAPPTVAVLDDVDGAAALAVRGLAHAAGIEPVEVAVRAADAASVLPGLVAAMPQPVASPRMLPAWFAAAALAGARAGLMLAEAGATPLLLSHPSYDPFRPRGWRRLLRGLAPPPLRRLAPSAPRRPPLRLFMDEAAGLLELELPSPPLPLVPLPDWLRDDGLAVAGLDDLCLRIADGDGPALDAAAQAHGIEARLPFLDEALADYALAVPGKVRARPKLLGDLVPAAALGRQPLPMVKLDDWLAGELGDLVLERAARWPLLDAGAVAALLAAHRAQGGHGDRLWGVLVLAEWCAGLGLDRVAPADGTAELVYSRS